MIKKFPLVSLGIALFLVFVFYSYLVHKDLFTAMDFNTTVRLQDHMPRRFDALFSDLSFIGRFEYTLILLSVVLLIRRKIAGIMVIGFFGLIHVFELYGKMFVNHLPPPHFMLRTENLGDFPQFYIREVFSYPSGHAARAAFLSIIFACIVAKTKRISPRQKVFIYAFLAIYDIVMFTSRVYLGEHWTTDVIGGSMLGFSLGLIALLFL